MATILLSAAGAALGGAMGGSVLGLSSVAVGRFAGAVIGRSIDQRLLGQGSDVVETGRVSRLRLTGAGEGEAVAQVYGRMRVAGQVIWATAFEEQVSVTPGSRGGKGSPRPPTPETRSFSYSVSLALALCEGEISHLGRIWADGLELDREGLTLRVYRGTSDQLPDPRIEAVEGAEAVPAYRGTAYVVIEDLALGPFGNRVPQFTFEVCRPSQPGTPGAELDMVRAVRGVALLPGSGEYGLATTPVRIGSGPGTQAIANVNSPAGKTDLAASLAALNGELPACGAAALIVSWFGDDLRCGECRIRPLVEQTNFDAANMPWQVSGLGRATADPVPRDAQGREVYGGTPTDQAVIEAIHALQAAGQAVMVYPFILMTQMPGNGLPDPRSDAGDQPVLPWRGRITTDKAPGQPGSPDGSPAAVAQVAAFFGTAQAADFGIAAASTGAAGTGGAADLLGFGGTVAHSPVSYSGPPEWSYRRFILHQAALCAAAGGVESFCIGSEMRGLTRIRGQDNSFPAVAQLIDLAHEVRLLLGPDVKISYAADWSEYFGYQPGGGDRFFHLDPLWADDDIDFIGIDNYMPLSDWRDGTDHLDARHWNAVHDLGYLQAGIEGGEGYDWFYPSQEARAAQRRVPITDAAHDEPWIWRYKDIRNWWLNAHHDRVGGVRSAGPTPWVPQSKPVRFTEYGCAAVDKGTNQPNRFLDPKSSESALPRHSSGQRDDLVQMQYLRAISGYWGDPARNPVSEVYGAPMIDMDRAYVWAWDARPFPRFPNDTGLWSDGANYARGHWITGRTSAQRLASVVGEVTARAGLAPGALDVEALHGLVRGYLVDQVGAPRAALQPLMLRFGADAVDRDGRLTFRLRDGRGDHAVDPGHVVRDPERDGLVELTRGGDGEVTGRVRLRFVEADGDFEVIAEEAILPDAATHAVATSEFPLAMTRAEGRQVVERWLSEARVGTDTLRLTLPPSQLAAGAGDVLTLPAGSGDGRYRIDRVEQMGNAQRIEAVRVEPETYRPVLIEDVPARLRPFTPPTPVAALFLDLPLMSGEELPHAPHLAVMADPWPGAAALYAADTDEGFALNRLLAAPSVVGVTRSVLPPARAGVIDRGDGVFVRMLFGTLDSITDAALLGGGNLCAIGDGTPDGWELLQFRDAELVAPGTYILRHRLRGLAGTEGAGAVPWPAGSYVVRLDGRPEQIALAEAQRGLARQYRIGPASRPVDDPSYSAALLAFDGLGLRPYAPVHLRARLTPDGETEIGWIRRTRLGGDRWDTPEVPLGEEREAYLLRLRQGATVLREVTLDVPRWTYTAGMRAADAPGADARIEVAQISARFGPGGFAARPLPG